ncbi:DUF1615 family protein [Hoeflea sp.]|uniref:DUF1615 family protein n=1 Tax=Hoeflea sp. TaxID=1940281 RepID=UPI003B526AEF
MKPLQVTRAGRTGLWTLRFVVTLIAGQFVWPGTGIRAQAAQGGIGVEQATRLIALAQPRLRDASGWAADILWAIRFSGQPVNAENVCAVIAVVDQETNFKINPHVQGMSRRALSALEDRLAASDIKSLALRGILALDPSIRVRLTERLRTATTERDLDLAYRRLVEDILQIETIIRLDSEYGLGAAEFLEAQNEVKTIGSMQVSVAAALDFERRFLGRALYFEDIYRVRDDLYTRRGGLLNGTRLLLGYRSGYTRKVHRFADYNAGRYASRNAAFQWALSRIGGKELSLDGDLLIYRDRKPSSTRSATERALLKIAQAHDLRLISHDIRRDLLREKEFGFTDTATFKAVSALYRSLFGRPAPFARLPEIKLESVKIDRQLTTAWFARRVDGRYKACMNRLAG